MELADDLKDAFNDAVHKNRLDEVRASLERGIDLNFLGPNSGYPPLVIAALMGHRDMVELLLDHGADINLKNEYGNTALAQAAYSGKVDVVEFLLDRGADPFSRNDEGETPCDMARASLQREHKDEVVMILELLAERTRTLETVQLLRQKRVFGNRLKR